MCANEPKEYADLRSVKVYAAIPNQPLRSQYISSLPLC